MMRASDGNGAIAGASVDLARPTSASATAHLNLVQGNQQAAVAGGAANAAIFPAWKAHAPLEPTLRQLQPVNDRRAQLARKHARAGNHQIAALYRRFHAVGVHTRQSHKNEDCAGRLQDVNRRLPGRQP